ncbi:UNVERIFIED_ORG: hypothetical protein J2X79_002971 [Arthrobacter globiformis]|nr:hypothetical protein [Arthrobacter globiformis]
MERCQMMCATEKIMSEVFESCLVSPFTADRSLNCCGSPASAAGTSAGPSGLNRRAYPAKCLIAAQAGHVALMQSLQFEAAHVPGSPKAVHGESSNHESGNLQL